MTTQDKTQSFVTAALAAEREQWTGPSWHSEGPWWTTDSGVRNRGGYIAHTNSVQRYEGQDERYAFEVSQREADKRLISAAPDLLAALMRCKFDSLNMSFDDLAFCRAAFVKATGAKS